MPDLLSDGWSDSDSSQDARDVEMDIVPNDDDDNWVDEDEGMPQLLSTVPVDQAPATDRRPRVEEEVEPQLQQPSRTPNPTPPTRSRTNTGPTQPFPTLPPWNFGLGTARPPGRLFPLFQNPADSVGNGNNASTHRGNAATNPHPQPTQPPQPDRNTFPGNAQQETRGPRFHAHTFVLGVDGTGRAVPIPPDAFSAMFGQFGPGMPQPQAQTPQPGQPPDQPDETRDQPRQPGDSDRVPPFVNFVVGGIGALPPFFATPFGPGPQPPADDPGDGGRPEPGGGAPAWAELLRAMFGGEPPEEREDPERAEKLVQGLERVPVGLVKRMTRVDGVPGAHEDSTGTDGGEVPGCAICWDSLLSEEPPEDAKPLSSSIALPTPEQSTQSPDSKPALSDPTSDDDTTAIICLPCSHVFHAPCLLPWFSKPKHTTCPTCRFDIDPRNLTYTPPMRPRPTPATTTTDAAPPNDTQHQPVSDPTATAPDSLPAPSPATHQAQGHEHPPPPEPASDENHDQLPGETRNDTRHSIPPPAFGFGFGLQQPPVYGPPPPPGHVTHGIHATTANAPHDPGRGPYPGGGPHIGPFPNFVRGGHAHLQGPGIAVDFTLHVPPEQGIDPERISQAVRDQAAAFMRLFAGGGRGPEMGDPTGPAPTPGAGGVNHEPEVPGEWIPPPAPGPTLRQRIEAKERQVGLRCHDPSCGIGPSDEDPFPEVFNDPNSPSIKRVGILKDGGEKVVCGHLFHPACLVSADRCAGWGEEDRPMNDDGEEYEVVSCPVCRSVGKLQREVWKEGAKALLV